MRCGSVVLSLLLLAGVSQAQITLGVGGGLLAAAGAAAVGGAALGVLGAALATRGRRGGRRRSFSRFARRRGRRAAPDQEVATEDTEEQSVIWGSVAAADQDGCALKLICLLEAADSQADSAEKAVLSFIGDLDVTRKAVVTSKLPYEAAGWLGKHRGSEACEAVYGTLCPYNKQDMMQLVSSVWSSMAKEEDNNVLSA